MVCFYATSPSGCFNPNCYACHSPLRPANLRLLAQNLATAATLCRAWQLGDVMDGPSKWAPGCGMEAP